MFLKQWVLGQNFRISVSVEGNRQILREIQLVPPLRNLKYKEILPPTPDPPPAISNCPKKPKSSHFLSKIYIFTEKGLAIHVLPVKKFLVWKSILAVHVPVSSTRYHRKGM